MSTISYLRLDAEYDPVFDPASALTDLQAVEQAIKTRILLFEGEWWENLSEGTPMFQQILGQRATPTALQAMALALTARISGTPYVSSVQDVTVSFNAASRALSYQATVQTAFGTVQVSNEPGDSASLGN
jgi:hypothetical protein